MKNRIIIDFDGDTDQACNILDAVCQAIRAEDIPAALEFDLNGTTGSMHRNLPPSPYF